MEIPRARSLERRRTRLRRYLPVLSVVCTSLTLTSSARAEGWPMFRGNRELTGVASGDLPEKPYVLWKFSIQEGFVSSAAIVNGQVFVGGDEGTLYALKLADGAVIWKQKIGETIRSSPTVASGGVFLGDGDGVFHCLDADTGSPRWTYQTNLEIISSANVAGDRVVFGSYDGHIYCLSAADGHLYWKFKTDGRIHATAAIVDDLVIVAGCDERLHILRLTDGESVRRVAMNSVSGCSAAISGAMTFVGTYGNHVLGIDWKKGEVVWTFEDSDRQFPYLSSAAVMKDTVVIGGRDKRIRAFDADTGKQKWKYAVNGKIDSSPVIVGERVFVGSSDGTVYGLRLRDGELSWKFEAGGPISASPAIAEGRLVIGTEDGTLYCFGAK